MIIETKRLILRPWTEADAADLYEYAKDPQIGPNTGWPIHTSEENSRMIIRTVLSVPENYAVCLKEDKRPIGCIGLTIGDQSKMKLPEKEGELGFWIGRPFWGQGLIPEAIRAVVRHAFVDLQLEALWCGYFDGNIKSRRCQEKCGFIYQFTHRDIYWALLDRSLTEHISRLTREEWKNSFTIRRLVEEDEAEALDLVWKVFQEYESPVYPREGTEEFRRSLDDENYMEGIEYYGAYDGDVIVGVIGIRKPKKHICFFFVDGRYHRLRIADRLFQLLEEDYAGEKITLNSSPYGLPFYDFLGFTATEQEQCIRGIRFTPMAKQL